MSVLPLPRDRFGLGWRPELAGALLLARGKIDVVEVIADDWIDAPAERLRALDLLASQVPVLLHGTGLGLASVEPVDDRRLEPLARLVERIAPQRWSEHLAFVRGGGVELGHLAAPPRRDSILRGLARNVERATRVVGVAPLLENVATLVEPPGSDRDDATFVAQALATTGCGLLLDLHNLLANSVNLRFDARAWLDVVPLERVEQVHLAGGVQVERDGVTRLLDDHLHDVPDPVYELLEELGARVPQPLTVLIERDGRYPAFDRTLAELERAREALARGRARLRGSAASLELPAAHGAEDQLDRPTGGEFSNETGLNALLARAYVDDAARSELVRAGPAAHGWPDRPLDVVGLELAAECFARKRAERSRS